MVDSVVSAFDVCFADECLADTPGLSFSFSNCDFLQLKSVFRLENPASRGLALRFYQCSFDRCLKPFSIDGSAARVKVEKCAFRGNAQCFSLRHGKEGSARDATPGLSDSSSLSRRSQPRAQTSLSVVKCSFSENHSILKAADFGPRIDFRANRVKLTTQNGLWFSDCANVSVSRNTFAVNFKAEAGAADERLEFDYQNFGEQLEHADLRLRQLKAKIKGPGKVLLRLVRSNATVAANVFRNNDGSLLVLTEREPRQPAQPPAKTPDRRLAASKLSSTRPLTAEVQCKYKLDDADDSAPLAHKLPRRSPRMYLFESLSAKSRARTPSVKSHFEYKSIVSHQSPKRSQSRKPNRSENKLRALQSSPRPGAKKLSLFSGVSLFSGKARAKSPGSKSSGFEDSSLEKEAFTVVLRENLFRGNPGCCLRLDESLANARVKVADNHFKTNLLDVVCRIARASGEVVVKRNTFEVAPGNPEKTIKIGRRLPSLKFRDNEFVRIKEQRKRNIWLRLLGCAEQRDSGFFLRGSSDSLRLDHEAAEPQETSAVGGGRRFGGEGDFPRPKLKMQNVLGNKRRGEMHTPRHAEAAKQIF